jgi:phosphoglycolate phosphatase-like HAD superfamily hydrolase
VARVLLFDIDGTLVKAGGAGRRALELSLQDHLGSGRALAPGATWLAGMKLDGMTDRLIVREALGALGLPFDEGLCARVLAGYVAHLHREIHAPGYRVLPGVAELLPRLARAGALLGLCTGNLAAGARVKLARGGLDRHFGFEPPGVFGFADDAEAREEIVAAALRRASLHLGRTIRPEEALVIGDTPRDVSAAHACGVPVLAVATGRFTVAELSACGAALAVASLEAPEAAEILLAGPGGRAERC